MTWAEIKEAVEQAGVKDDDEIRDIVCENGKGDKTFHKVKLGRAYRLTEEISERPGDFAGCAV